MIIAPLSDIQKYSNASVKEFVKKLTAGLPDGEYPLDGENCFARLQTYHTKLLEETRFETHRRYADIQILLTGKERIDITPAVALVPETEYNTETDVQFYKPVEECFVTWNAVPDYFGLFEPSDAHRPQISVQSGKSEWVRKVVIKIKFQN
ncbi:hypothetical protein FACS189419_01320 [Planctomycetales bacterium]|nr:hypothetical protein FACS189419_01320 [Planctomycetales bacterium]